MKYLMPLGLCLTLFACKTTEIPNKPISIDFENPEIPKVVMIKPKQNIVITLKNVNPYLYEITSQDSLIVYQNDQPALFGQAFKLPSLNATPTEAPPSNPKVNGAAPSSASAAERAKDNETLLERSLKTFVAGYPGKEDAIKNVLLQSKVADDIIKLLDNCHSSINDLKVAAKSFISSKMSVDTASLPLGIQSEIEKISSDARNNMLTYLSTGEDLKKEHRAVLDGANGLTLSEYRSIEKDINKKITVIDNIIENGKKLLSALTDFDAAKVGVVIEDNYKKVMTSRIEKIIPVSTQHRTDEVSIIINVKKKKEVFCTKEISKIPITAFVIGGVKIDFSTGLVFNIGNKKFFDQNYYYDSVYRNNNIITDSVKISRSRNNNVVIPSLGAFFHVYTRLKSSWNGGGMVGASLGSDQRTYFHVGLCTMIGKSDRIIIGGGLSFAGAQILDGKFEQGQIIKRGLAPTSVPVENATRVGYFVSVSWNLNLIR